MLPHASPYSLAALAEKVGGQLQGDPECQITSVASLDSAQPGSLAFFINPKWMKALQETQASAVILSQKTAASYSGNAIIVDLPELAFAKIAALFEKRQRVTQGVHATAVLGDDVVLGDAVSLGAYVVLGDRVQIGARSLIHPGCVIGDDVVIGEDCVIYPRVSIYHDVVLGHRVMIHSGAVLGADGFGLAHDAQKRWHKIPQVGTLIIQDDAEIGANTTLDRGALKDTRVGVGVKIDNQVQIGHNAEIGDHTAIAGCVGIAGSTKVGRYCMLGGGSGINGHITITDSVMITAMSGVVRSIETPGVYSGSLVTQTNREWRKNMVAFGRLYGLEKRVRQLEKAREE